MDFQPLVSVVIVTRNRAEYLKQSIHSVLTQTFKNFELVIVDDGSTDGTEELVKSINDNRIVYTKNNRTNRGISAARNVGAELARGLWTAVHDDDDLMLPWRLEKQLEFAEANDDFVFGSFINFDDMHGELQFHHGRQFNYGSALQTGFAPGHSTWLIKSDLIRKFRYDEGLESAVDNNLAFRMLRAGISVRHSGVVCLLRRVHSGRITDTGGAGQKYAAALNLRFLRSGINKKSQEELWLASKFDWGPADKTNWEVKYLPFLPDHLVKRSGHILQKDGELERTYSVIPVGGMSWSDFYEMAGARRDLSPVYARYKETPRVEMQLNKQSDEELKLDIDVIEQFVMSNLSPIQDGTCRLLVWGDDSSLSAVEQLGLDGWYEFSHQDQKLVVGFQENINSGELEARLKTIEAYFPMTNYKLLTKEWS